MIFSCRPKYIRKFSSLLSVSHSSIRYFSSSSDTPFSGSVDVGAVKKNLASCHHYIHTVQQKLDASGTFAKLEKLSIQLEDPHLWDDPTTAQQLLQKRSQLGGVAEQCKTLQQDITQWEELYALAGEEGDEGVVRDCVRELDSMLVKAQKLQVQTLMDGEADGGGCYVEVQAGAGGEDSADWARMLVRMYSLWGKRCGFAVEGASSFEAAAAAASGEGKKGGGGGGGGGLLLLEGSFAYGRCRLEAGTHRLVRISPFDAAGRRHTSFAQVRVYPAGAVGGPAEGAVSLPPTDLRIDTFKSQGAGGQSVNTTDSAVRATHLPTGLVAVCSAERSQHRNKKTALDLLQAKVYQRTLDEREGALRAHAQGLGVNGWGGSHIRSYIMHPYQMVKDHRSGVVLQGGGGGGAAGGIGWTRPA